MREAISHFNVEWTELVNRTGDELRIVGERESAKISESISALAALEALFPGSPTAERLSVLTEFLRGIRYYPLNERTERRTEEVIIRDSAFNEWTAKYKTRREPDASVPLRLLYLKQERSADFEELKTLIGPDGLGILHDIKVVHLPGESLPRSKEGAEDTSDVYHIVEFHPNSSHRQWFPYSDLSMGTRRLLRVLLAILCDDNSVMLCEQPEDSIHPGLLNKLIALLKSYSDRTQFIVASHSPQVFNNLVPEELRIVTMKSGQTSADSLTFGQIEAAKQFICEQGTLADFLETIMED